MGKVLVEKLLRTCDVDKIFLLMRPKATKDVHTRLQDMLNSEVKCPQISSEIRKELWNQLEKRGQNIANMKRLFEPLVIMG